MAAIAGVLCLLPGCAGGHDPVSVPLRLRGQLRSPAGVSPVLVWVGAGRPRDGVRLTGRETSIAYIDGERQVGRVALHDPLRRRIALVRAH